MDFRKVGILGAGNIGVGAVTDLVLHDISAVVVDISEEILRRAEAEVLKNIRGRSPVVEDFAPDHEGGCGGANGPDDRPAGARVVRLHHRERHRKLGNQEAGL
jgi:threonine dehydrogenase-like Zn-dependent dehydrogenase